ncbi:hypothetical protein MOBT1_002394 [Malassezia obtusa]|uniref:ATP synthase subunit d, mitochondrial n=1 Tax=Malassezia obtusa TaxID=76774 RepID=A0AAF0E297_9BASI|nr:hypothetical protein MOBT1_002394 [Malassezia obtusa]
MASKAAVDFSKVLASGLGKQTAADLVAFRKRSDEARRVVSQLKQLPTTVDFAHYKNVLKNKDVIAEAEKIVNNFKPTSYDVGAQLKALDSFEATAVKQAEESATKIESELKDLKETLSNIEGARPFDQLTATDVINARPEIAKAIEEMVKKGKWSLPGYDEKFGRQFSGLHGSSPFGGNVTAEDDFPPGFNLARRTSVSAESMSPRVGEISGRAPRAQTPKTESQEQRIHAAVSQNLIFRHLEPEQYQAALLALEEVHKQPDDIVIKQGDQGDYFYIVESGELDVYLQPPGTSPNDALAAPPDRLGNKVVTYGPGATFGELALLYMQPRAASIVATAPCTLWALDRVTFRSILAETNLTRRDLIASFLRQVPLLQHLNDAECERVLDAIEIQDFNPGEVVVREGDMGTHFFLVVNGVAEVLKAGESGAPVTRLQRGDYFGELALMHRAPRAATVRAAAQANMGQLRVAALEEQAFTRLLGPLAGIMARHAETHYHQEGAAPAAAPNTPSKTGQGLLDIPSVGQAPGSPRSGV